MFDLLRCVFFHQSVVCRDSQRPTDEPEGAALRRLWFAAREKTPEGDVGEPLRSALELLSARVPEIVSFSELRAALDADPEALGDALLEAFRAELVMPHAAPLLAVSAVDVERPVASPLARWQARKGAEVTSLAYTSVHMEEPAARLLLTLLDGTRDRAAIRAEFAERTGVRLSAEDLDANLEQLGRLCCALTSRPGGRQGSTPRRSRAPGRSGAAPCRTGGRAGRARARRRGGGRP